MGPLSRSSSRLNCAGLGKLAYEACVEFLAKCCAAKKATIAMIEPVRNGSSRLVQDEIVVKEVALKSMYTAGPAPLLFHRCHSDIVASCACDRCSSSAYPSPRLTRFAITIHSIVTTIVKIGMHGNATAMRMVLVAFPMFRVPSCP